MSPSVVGAGAFDDLRSGHLRFLEEAVRLGPVTVVLTPDAAYQRLAGRPPRFPFAERGYAVGSVRYVTRALVSSGQGWLDADPEITELQPDIYAVNEDGDRGGKREYCARRGLEYLVLRRAPAPGQARRSSTDLRGF